MNEEELKEERDLKATLDMWENMEEEQRLMQLRFLLDQSFQKGKLEQKKEELEFLENLWKIKGRLPIEIFDRIEQLQKEIGGMK